ncbi:MAG TPA: response regulator [Bacteroidota bacterium]|nr:response regulator [Bacteroidota bacterium]
MDHKLRILLVEDNRDFAKLVQVYLQRYDAERFEVVWKENHADAMAFLHEDAHVDVALMDYFLPGKTGLDIARDISSGYPHIPIIFLTVNKDFHLALEVMKLGVAEFLVKEEISSPVLPKTILNVVEKQGLKDRLMKLEISRQRLRAIRDTLSSIVGDFEVPLREMEKLTERLGQQSAETLPGDYLEMIDDNVRRIVEKLNKLKTLQEDKTVRYIKDIKMLDLS